MGRKRDPSLYLEPRGFEGLTQEQAAARARAGLANNLTRSHALGYIRIVLRNLLSWFNIILFAVAIVFLVFGVGFSRETQYGITKYGFLVPVVLNLFIGTYQECRAKYLIDKLTLVNEQRVEVFRDGSWITINASAIVFGDLIRVKQGMQVPIDGVLLDGFLDLDESILTGEQKERRRQAGEDVLAGAAVIAGSAQVRVREVGRNTYAQRLRSGVAKQRKPKPEMVRSIDGFVLALSILIVPLAILSGWVSYSTLEPFSGSGLLQDVAVTVGTTIVGAIPTGLVLLASARCALSVIALYKEKTSVKELKSVEGLAMSTVVCLDKTGTLTTGHMQFKDIHYAIADHALVDRLLAGVLRSVPDNSETAAALRTRFADDAGLKAVDIVPFNSKIKYSGCSFEGHEGSFYALGAPQFLLKEGSSLLARVSREAAKGLRVLAFVRRRADGEIEPLALLYLSDEIRPGAREVIRQLVASGVEIKIISGDDPVTVSAIAARLGVPQAERYLNMKEVDGETLRHAGSYYAIFGRTTPEQKRDLIRSLQVKGKKVTMVIDALNDLLAAKAADCSICIAHEGGSSAAAQVADVTILDGDFGHMPAIIKEGRKSVNDMQRSATLFLMKSFLALGLAATSPLFGHIPYSVEGLYLVTWFVTGVGGFILGLEDTNDPVKPGFTKRVLARSLPAGLFLFLSVFAVQLMVRFDAMPFAEVYLHSGLKELPPEMAGQFSIGQGITYSEYLNLLGTVADRDMLLRSLLFIEEPTCIFAAVIAAFAVLFSVCQPLNKFRITAMGICATIVLGAVLIMPMFFLGADNIPSGMTLHFVPFWSDECYFAAIGRELSSWVFLVCLAAIALPFFALLKHASEVWIFRVDDRRFTIVQFSSLSQDDSLRRSLYTLFGRSGHR